MDNKNTPQHRRSSVESHVSAPYGSHRPSSGDRQGLSSAASLDSRPAYGLHQQRRSSGGGMGPAISRSPQPPDINEDTPFQGFDGEPDPFSAGHELYRALRGDKGDDPLTDELLWEGDFMSTQRDFIQKKQEDEMLERLERRMGRIRAAPTQKTSGGGAADESAPPTTSSAGTPPALAGLAMAAATGVRLKNLLGRVMPTGSSADGIPRPVSATGAAGAVAERFGSEFTPAPGQLTPVQPGTTEEGALLSVPESPAVAAETTTPRFLSRITSSIRRQASLKEQGAAAAVGALGMLVAEDDSKRKAAEALPPVEIAAQAAPAAAAAAAGQAQPADAVVQVVKVVPKELTAKQQEEKERAAAEELQRMDTDGRLQFEMESYSWPRRMAVKICTHSDFELMVMLLIFANCVSLALYDPLQAEDNQHNGTLTKLDLGLNVAFTVEMILRIISMGGILHYLHHPWNAFDCVMVLAGYTTFIPTEGSSSAGLEGVKALRALRAMRPLRTITRFAALRSIVVCFLEAVPLLVSVAAMLFFFLFLFAVAASEIFGDAFHYGCTDPDSGAMEIHAVPVEDEFGCGDRQCPQEFRECRLYEQSLATQIAGFENVAMSMLSVFQAMTLTNWSFTMYRTMDFLSPAVVIYWFVMIIFGAYFVLNLFLAVLKTKFAKAKNLLDEKRRQRRALKAGRGSKKRNVLARATGWMKTRVTSYVSSKAGKDSLSSHVDAVVAKKTMSEFGDFGTPRSNLTGFTDFIDSQRVAGDPPGVASTTPAAGNVSFKPQVTRQLSRMDSGASGYSGFSGETGITNASGVSAVSAQCLLSFEEFDESTQDLPRLKRTLLRGQYRVRALVCSSAFNNIYLVAILLNTVALAIVYDGMSAQVEEALAYANFVFTGAFALEMILKLIGLGPWRYLSDAWNMFDALVVAFSLVELVTELMARSSANGLSALRSVRSLRVLRSFRVLRVMKMFKYLESLKMIAAVLISSMASFASIVVLLVLFWLVFSIVGLHVFGGLPIDVPFPNCDTLINSLILNFHILNLENFQISMYSVIRASSYASSMYWLAWIVIGKFIFLTLFLAVTLDAFERKYEADMKKGVRSQSMASTIFSRIKKAGQRVKSIAASMAGGSNSGRSTFSMWRPGASSKGSGGNSASHHLNPGSTSTSQHGGSAAAGGTAMSLPGQAFGDGVAVVSAAAGSGHDHSQPRGTREHRTSRCTSELGSDVGDATGSHHSHQHRHGHSHEHHQHDRRPSGENRRSSTEDSRRPKGERRRSSLDLQTPASPPGTAAHAGPVAESASVLQEDFDINFNNSWAPGIRLRRLRAGMQQQYSCAKHQDAEMQGSVSLGWGSGPIRSQLAAESYTRRSSSSGSSNSSFTLKQEAAAAFAAAAAAEALGPCHVLPDLFDDDAGLVDWMARHSNSSAPTAKTTNAGQAQHSSRSTSKSSSWNSQQQHEHGEDEADFTWQEFLATVAAINYPSLHRMQQQGQLLLEEGSAKTVATAKSAASLGPIAEGLEHMDAAVPDQHVAPASPKVRGAPTDVGRLSFSSPGQLTVRKMAGQAVDGPAQQQQQPHKQQESPSKLGCTSPTRAPALQQLAMDGLDKELASLGLQSTGAEASTPTLTFGSSAGSSFGRAAAASAAEDSLWPGLDADTAEYSRRHAGSPGARTGSPAPAAATREAPAQSAPEAKPAKDPARRVTLFTESMRNRGECPAPPRSPRFEQRVNSKAARQLAAPSGLKLDELLEQHAAETPEVPAGGGSKAGSRPASAAGSSHSAAALLVLAEASVEPGVTAQAIRRRKAAAVTFAPEEAPCCVSNAPQAIAESVQASGPGQSTTGGVSFAAVPAAGSEGQSQVSSARRTSRATSDNGSEGGLSDGGQSYMSGDGSRSGAWSTMSGLGRSRSRTFPELSGVSLWVFPQENRFRQALYDLVTRKYFDYLMFVLIILNCVAMAYEYPTMSKEDLDGKILFWSDVVFTAAFTIEAVLKIIAFGFKPYLSFFQNIIDILIVISSLVMLLLDTMAEISVIKGLRVLRAIKPLRALTRSAGMQQIFKSLTLSLAAMGNVSIVVLLFFLIFAILGVQLFHGKFWSCNDPTVPDKDACTGTVMLDGQETERVWSNPPYNFDHLGMALVSLFITVTLNGYAEIMNAAMAAPEEPGLQPQPMSNWSSFFFFAAFVLVVGYTLLNLYIGVVFYQFSRIRMQSQTGSAFLTDDQTEWVEMSKLVFRLKPPEKSPVPVNKMRRRLYYLVQGKAFEYVIMAVIVANSALMATSYYGQPEEMSRIVEAINYAFTGVYVLEFVFKVVGLGWRNYWKNMWNKFDCILLVTGLVDMAVTLAVGPGVASFLKIQKIMRLLRLARVVKLMRSMKGLRSLFGTLIVALPAFWNVGGLLALMFFIYAYVGMLLLGHVKRNGGLNEHTNFERFWTAALTLFKVATNDNWTDVMVACMVGPPDCDPAVDCGSWVVYPYFISFVVLVSIIMLQLFTAVIIESFEAQEEQDRWKLRPDHLDEFVELWAEYDDGSGNIDPKDLEAMLLRLSPPLGLGKGASSTDVLRFVFDLDIPLLNGRVPFQRTAYELVRRCSRAEIPEGILKDQINKLVTRAFRNLKADEVLNFSVAVTVMRVQRKWRARMRAAKMKRKKEFRADRGMAPSYADIVACRDTTLKSALQRRQAGDLRWRPSPAYSELWAAAEAVLAAEAAAAVVYSRRSSGSSADSGKAGPGGRWSSLAGLRASADGWMQRMTDGFAGGLQRIKGAGGGLFARSHEEGADGARSGRSSIWGFASRATSKATSKATSVAGHDTAGQSAATSTVASRATSRAISDAASMVVSEVGTVDSAL